MGLSTHKPRADLAVVCLHWLVVIAVATSLATGARMASDRGSTVAAYWAAWLSSWPQGAVVQWHLIAGLIVAGLSVAYLFYLAFSAKWRVLVNTPARSGGWLRWLANLSSLVLLLLLLGLLLTGGWLVMGAHPTDWIQWHAGFATAMIVLVAMHVMVQTLAGRFWAMWRVRWQRLALGVTVAFVAVASIALSWWWLTTPAQTLTIEYARAEIELDGRAGDPVWASLVPVTVSTQHGLGFDQGQTDVTVKGFHDGMSIFLLVQWSDATASQQHLPLERTATGWRLLSHGIERDDETRYYEDKLVLAWADKPQLASAFSHLGQDLLPGPHRPVTRGLHFTTDGSLIDLWHWKALRTGEQLPGRMDDNYLGAPVPSVFVGHRYTGGYQPDWGSAGYSLNICLRDDPDCLAVLERIEQTGEYEPVPGSARQRLQQCLATPDRCEARLMPMLLPRGQSDGSGTLTPSTADVWTPGREAGMPEGSLVPGVQIDGRLGQGRGDVRAAANWHQGLWTLEIQRALTTRDDKDISLMPGIGPRYLWIAPFDGVQTRHAYHLRPVHVVIEPVSD